MIVVVKYPLIHWNRILFELGKYTSVRLLFYFCPSQRHFTISYLYVFKDIETILQHDSIWHQSLEFVETII